ncbi:ferritin-like domain-containing protein [Hymenobacter sediminis]|uniref:ferritin-like domain-containing protein n=1 Tax=Hymenobacter sediminis TaxID=2218621 RepID=UPI000DA69214|nr:ferritin-like domain-containing protein [Hymenobacter sediminis]RPD48303.1 ferritin-like domain-containing protein [Hymenobacter sediminis]
MNFFHLLSELEQLDPELGERLDSRRAVFKHLGGMGQKLTAAALPLAIGAIFNKAYGQTPAGLQVVEALNFALKLEYLELSLYKYRASLTGLSAPITTSLNLIAADEANHVAFLRTIISAMGGTPIAEPPLALFDFTAGIGSMQGPYIGFSTNPAVFLVVAQALEDLGVRAYKGLTPTLMTNKTMLTAALNIHSIEARHSAQIRAIRRALATSASTPPSQGVPGSPNAAPKSWVSGTDRGGPAPGSAPFYTSPIYEAGNKVIGGPEDIMFHQEANTIHLGVALTNNLSAAVANFPLAAFTEAFDEGLDVTTVSTIARPFVLHSSKFF